MNLKPTIRACATLAAIGAAALSMSQIAKTGSKYTLRMLFKTGSVMTYDVSSTGSAMGAGASGSMIVNMPLVIKVLGVSNGIGTLQYTVGPVLINGKPLGQGAPSTATIKVNSRGKPVEGASPGAIAGIGYPEKPVAVGESWQGDMTAGMGPAAGTKVNATYKLMGFRTVGGKSYAVIGTTSKTGGGSQGISTVANGTMLMNTADGSLFSADLVMTVSMTSSGQAQTSKSTFKVTRKS